VGKGIIAACIGLAMAAVFVLSACGGGGSESLSKADYVRKGNAVCGKWQQARGERFSQVSAEVKPPITEAKREKAILKVLEPYEDAIAGLKELSPPSGEEQQVEAMIEAMEEAMARTQSDPRSAITSGLAFRKSNKMLETYGLKECKV